ncbi:MAG TPA: protein kinase family protein, partial [bacterium]|nr:protein kinase family protein [bacterium]
MGRLFRARTPEGQNVVVKVVAPGRIEEAAALREEVRFLSRLRHPNLVAFLGFADKSDAIFGEDRGPCYWMEDAGGQEILPASRGKEPGLLFSWFREGLEALRYLHSQKVLHGDLSPRNILIGQDGRLKLLDFGTAGFLGEAALLPSAATFPYAAPERLSGV